MDVDGEWVVEVVTDVEALLRAERWCDPVRRRVLVCGKWSLDPGQRCALAIGRLRGTLAPCDEGQGGSDNGQDQAEGCHP